MYWPHKNSTVLMVRTTQMDSKIPDLSFQVLRLEKLMSMHHAIAYLYNNLKPRRRKRRGVTWSLEDSPQEPGSRLQENTANFRERGDSREETRGMRTSCPRRWTPCEGLLSSPLPRLSQLMFYCCEETPEPKQFIKGSI